MKVTVVVTVTVVVVVEMEGTCEGLTVGGVGLLWAFDGASDDVEADDVEADSALSMPPRRTSKSALTSPVMPATFFVSKTMVDWGGTCSPLPYLPHPKGARGVIWN